MGTSPPPASGHFSDATGRGSPLVGEDGTGLGAQVLTLLQKPFHQPAAGDTQVGAWDLSSSPSSATSVLCGLGEHFNPAGLFPDVKGGSYGTERPPGPRRCSEAVRLGLELGWQTQRDRKQWPCPVQTVRVVSLVRVRLRKAVTCPKSHSQRLGSCVFAEKSLRTHRKKPLLQEKGDPGGPMTMTPPPGDTPQDHSGTAGSPAERLWALPDRLLCAPTDLASTV